MSRYKSYGYGSGYGYGSSSYGYGSTYGSTRKKYSYSDWGSWGSYGFDSQDNDDSLVVKEPENYSTPTAKDIETKASVWKQSAVDQIKELARVCYFKMIEDKDYFKPEYADFSKFSGDEKEALSKKKELYDKIYDTYIPGFTPLEQAIAIFKKIQQEGKETGKKEDKNDFTLDKQFMLDFDREVYSDPNINEQLELNDVSKTRKMSVLDKISIIGQLGSQFKVEKEVDEKIVSNSDTYAKKMMSDYAQIAQVDLYQKLFPNFPVKLLTKDLIVNVPVDRKEQKQKIIIILDESGSMWETFKQDWVNAIMIDRLKYVLKGEAEVFFSYFVSNPNEMHFQHIHNRETVMKFWQTFSNEPDGGMTKVGEMVNHIAASIENKKLCNLDIDLSEEKPEILVINDGDDNIHSNAFPYKVNAICLGTMNNQLKDLCIAAKGKKVFVSEEDKVTAYSEAGEEIIA
jgi:uncharacterized protein with von Willebrand factor type A (vWA) domain